MKNQVNRHVAYKTRQVKNVLEFIEEGKLSQTNYISTSMPFFMRDNANSFSVGHFNIPELPEGLNRNIKTMYKLLGNQHIELYIRDWTFMSLNQA